MFGIEWMGMDSFYRAIQRLLCAKERSHVDEQPRRLPSGGAVAILSSSGFMFKAHIIR